MGAFRFEREGRDRRRRAHRLWRDGGDAEARERRGSGARRRRSRRSRELGGRATRRIASDFSPLTDMRATAAYRAEVAANLLTRALLEVAGASAPTRIGDLRAAE